jgi:sensor histidine kinase YesM
MVLIVRCRLIFYLLLFFFFFQANGKLLADIPMVRFEENSTFIPLRNSIQFLEDKSNSLTINEVLKSNQFQNSGENVLNLGITDFTFWIKFSVKNLSLEKNLLIDLAFPSIEEVELFYPDSTGKYNSQSQGEYKNFKERPFNDPEYIFPVYFPNKSIQTYYLKLRCKEQLMVPLYIGTYKSIIDYKKTKDYFSGIYAGIILVMILYNLFLYFTIKDKSYLYYVLYTFTIGLVQICAQGYTFQFIYPNFPSLARIDLFLCACFVGIAGVEFVKRFLLVNLYLKKLIFFLNILNSIYIIAILISFLGFPSIAYQIINLNAAVVSISLIYIGFATLRKGYDPAKYFLIAQMVFLIGVTFYTLSNYGFLPYNNITRYTMQVGSIIDVILLSLALADRINMLKKENDAKQEQIIKHLKENEAYLKISQELVVNSERLKKEILSSNYESLKNQINPHFLFNSLNVLTELVHRNQNDAALFVKELADIYRYVLENKNKEVVPIETELKFIKSFTYLLKIRFSTNLIVNIKYNEGKPFMIVPLTLQLLVENCIKHNIVSSEKPLTIDIFTANSYLIVSNNLQLKKSSDSSKVGLTNIQNRYSYLSNEEVIIINDDKNFSVKVPLLKTEGSN